MQPLFSRRCREPRQALVVLLPSAQGFPGSESFSQQSIWYCPERECCGSACFYFFLLRTWPFIIVHLSAFCIVIFQLYIVISRSEFDIYLLHAHLPPPPPCVCVFESTYATVPIEDRGQLAWVLCLPISKLLLP